MQWPDIFEIASVVGSIAFALSGFLVGIRKHMDLMGIFIVSMLTANGGGAIRDVLVGKTPAVLTSPSAFYLVLAVILIALLLRLHHRKSLEQHVAFILSDAIGLIAFSVTGALVALEAGLSIFGVMVLAFVTATGGGIMRDMMVNEVPTLLSSDFYGTVALLVALALYCLHAYEMDSSIAIATVFIAALTLRLLAYFRGWHLPRINF